MTTIVTRAGKGSPLTNTEMDTNLTNLNSYKVEQDISGNATITGDVYLTGSGKRITGDFSNATVANRVMFQTSTVNGASNLAIIPGGTATQASIGVFNSSDPANSSTASLLVSTTESRFSAGQLGTGTYLPMTFYTGGSERMRIDTSGNVGIGVSPNVNWGSGFKTLELGYSGSSLSVNTINGNAAIRGNLYVNASVQSIYANTGFATVIQALPSSGIVQLTTFPSASAGAVASAAAATFQVSQTDCTMITPNGGLGYGAGAGGTVTQATSKSTAVTLNKPTGQITMNNAALAANTSVPFVLNNSLISSTDVILVNIKGGIATYATYLVSVDAIQPGLAVITLRNITGNSLSEAVVLSFAIIKGAAS